MNKQDDRTPEQVKTHHWLIVGTDRFMSGWGGASGGTSVAAWACKPEHRRAVLEWVESRGDMSRVREATDDGEGCRYRPGKGCAHLHIYVVDDDHPALDSLRRRGLLHGWEVIYDGSGSLGGQVRRTFETEDRAHQWAEQVGHGRNHSAPAIVRPF